MAARQVVTLRDERDGADRRHLAAYLDDEGDLHIDGQDLGPGTRMVSEDGEYEWFTTIAAADLPRWAHAKDGLIKAMIAVAA